MKPIKYQVIYGNTIHEFEDGLECFLFQQAVLYDFDKRYGNKALMKYISLTYRCIRNDCHSTPIENFAEFVARKWRTVKDMDSYELLECFYDSI